MKKLLISLFIAAAFLYAVWGDSSSIRSDKLSEDHGNIIQHISIDNDEYNVMKSSGMFGHSFIYRIDLRDHSISNIEYWIERYTSDGKSESILSGTKMPMQPNDGYKLYFSAMDVGEGNEVWVLSMRNGGNIGSTNTIIPKGNAKLTISGNILKTRKITKEEPIDLAMIKRSSEGNGLSFNEQDKTNLEENEELFVLRCRFY